MNNSSSNSCATFSDHDLNTIMATKISTSAISFVTCVLTFILMCCLRKWKTLVHRLTLYLTAVAILLSVIYILQVLPIPFDGIVNNTSVGTKAKTDSWKKACEGITFLHMYALWVRLLVICWIVIYLLHLTHYSLLGRGKKQSACERCSPRAMEATGIILTLIFPLTFLWVPFVTENYGITGPWCGIVIKHNSCDNESIAQGLGIQIGLWYAPAFATGLLCTVGMIIVIYRLCRFYYKVRSHRQQISHLVEIIIDGIPLIIYLVVFNVINLVDTANVSVHATRDYDDSKINMKLWIIHSFAGPSRALMIPFAFVLSQFIKHIPHWFRKRESTTTIFRVSTEWTEVDPLIIRQETTNRL